MDQSSEKNKDFLLTMIRLRRRGYEIPGFGFGSDVDKILPSKIEHPTRSPYLASSPSDKLPKQLEENSTDFRDQIRRLCETKADWRLIKSKLKKYLCSHPSESTAAYFLEIAFLYGDRQEVMDAYGELSQRFPKFYWKLPASLRQVLLQQLWNTVFRKDLEDMIHNSSNEFDTNTQPLEHAVFVLALLRKKLNMVALEYCLSHFSSIDAFQQTTSTLGITELEDDFLRLARAASDAQYREHALEFLRFISPDSSRYSLALQITQQLQRQVAHKASNLLIRDLLALKSWKKRLYHLDHYLQQVPRKERPAASIRNTLSPVLTRFFDYFPLAEDSVAACSYFLWRYRFLRHGIPEILTTHREKMNQFDSHAWEMAFWQPVAQTAIADDWESEYVGCAKAHQFVAGTTAEESLLWEAKTLYFKLAKSSHRAEWAKLTEDMYESIQHSTETCDSVRQRKLSQLCMVKSEKWLTLSQVERYLNRNTTPHPKTMHVILQWSRTQRRPKLEKSLVIKQAGSTHLTNDHLNRLWQASHQIGDSDGAWRIATVAMSRGYAHRNLAATWKLSSECVANFPLGKLEKNLLATLCWDFQEHHQQLCEAVFHIGPQLHHLFAILCSNAQPTKQKVYSHSSEAHRFQKHLFQQPYSRNKKGNFDFSLSQTPYEIKSSPYFVQLRPQSNWFTLMTMLCERFNLNLWAWNLDGLSVFMDKIIPRYSSKVSHHRLDIKVEKWIKRLNSDQRRSWYHLRQAGKQLDQDELREALAQFLIRLTTLIYPNHYQALTSMQAMRCSLSLLWQLEKWIISDAYGSYRQSLGLAEVNSVPTSLQMMPEIMTEPFV